jgi:hypothetical protein
LAGFIPGVFPEPAALVKPEISGDARIDWGFAPHFSALRPIHHDAVMLGAALRGEPCRRPITSM